MLGFGSWNLSAQYREYTNKRSYAVQIDISDGYISGLCFMRSKGDITITSIVNEFGVKVLTYSYDAKRRKVQIFEILKQIDYSPMRCVLRRNMRKITPALLQQPKPSKFEYRDKRRNITYRYAPIVDNPKNINRPNELIE